MKLVFHGRKQTTAETASFVFLVRACAALLLGFVLFKTGLNEAHAQGQQALQSAAAHWEPGWAKWTREPGFLALQMDVSVEADTNTPFTVTAGSASFTNVGVGCSTFTAPARFEVPAKPNQPFQLNLLGSNVYSVNISIIEPCSTELRASRTVRGKPVTPSRLKVYVNGTEMNAVTHVNTNFTCSQYVTSWAIEIRPDKNALRQNSFGRDVEVDLPESQAPGDADWPEIGPGKSAIPGLAPIRWSAGIGRLLSGKSAGRILYREYGLNSNSYTPASFFLYQPLTNHNQVVVVTNAAVSNALVLRQIKAPQALVDFPTNTTNSAELRFYLPSQVSSSINTNTGCYDILTNSPFVVWRFSNPDQNPATTRRLRITEERPGLIWTNEAAYDPTNQVWSLTRGSGGEQYRETRSVAFQTYVDEFFNTITNRIETNQVADATGRLGFEAIETYQLFDWGWGLISVVVDPRTNALTTTYHYSADKLTNIVYPDGSWETRLDVVVKPYKDAPVDDSTGTNNIQIYYNYAVVPETGEVYLRDIYRYALASILYRYDTTKKEWIDAGKLERESYQMGWLPSCSGSMVREGALRFSVFASAEAAGYPALTLTNYHFGVTNSYEFGVWSNAAFQAGAGSDWRRSAITGWGTLRDPESAFNYDSLDILPGKSVKTCEMRRQGSPIARESYVYADAVTNGTSFNLLYRDFLTNDALGHVIGQQRFDGSTGAGRTLLTADRQGTNQFPGPLLLTETDEDGVSFKYTYDSVKRVKTSTMIGANGLPDCVVTLTYDACDRILSLKTNAGGLSLSNQFAYDLSGRVTRIIDQTGSTTIYDYPSNGISTRITIPGGATNMTTRYLSGEPKSETGNASVQKYYDHQYFPTDNFLSLTTQKNTNAMSRTTYFADSESDRKTTTYYNMWDLPVWEVSGGYLGIGQVTNYYYYANQDDNITSTQAPGADPNCPLQTYFTLDSEHHRSASWLYVNGSSGHLDFDRQPMEASGDRLTRTVAIYTNIGGAWFRATNTYAYLTDNSSAATLISSLRQRLNGFLSNVKAESVMVDPHSNTLTTTVYVDRANKKLTAVTVSTTSTLSASNVVINGLLQSQSTLSVAAPTTYGYDSLRRPIRTTSPAGATMTTVYEAATGRVSSIADFAGNTTSYEYYQTNHLNAGRVKCVTAANGKKTYYEYTARGELYHTWGDVPYPEERIYRDTGELAQLHTYRGGSGWNGATWPASPGSDDVANWWYDGPSGVLLGKTDANGKGITNVYYANNALYFRLWARGVRATNLYSASGDLYRVAYSDSLTPTVTYTNWNRAGQPRTIFDASGQHTLTYDYASRLVSDYCPSGLVAGVTVSNHFNAKYGRDYLEVQSGAFTLHHDFGYDTYGRLNMVSNGTQAAIYSYLPGTDRLQSTAFHSSGSPVMTTTRAWLLGERLQSIANMVNLTTVSSHAYLYDAVHRRTQANMEDGSLWKYDYDDRNQLTAGKRYWADWAPVSGQRFEYAYDNIGNRTNAASGGDVNGASLRTTTYAVNNLNQYTTVTTPGYKDILGVALATNGVTVNSGSCDRKGEYFHREITVANSSSAVWQSVTVSSAGNSTNGNLAVPKNAQSYTYDLDGNLTYDGLWFYTWDGENRLTGMSMASIETSGFPAAQRKFLGFAYDQLGRRIRKIMGSWNGGGFTNYATNFFVYDGWNLVGELDHLGNVMRSYTWGQDLSGKTSLDQKNAGGVGGLLLVREHGSGTTNHFAGYDGNGNVLALVKTDASVSARYEYSPFAELIRSTGPLARANPLRWSTKFTDEESGLLYYGFRVYSPSFGRWLSKDPAGESGGRNLYAFVLNGPTVGFDTLGDTRIEFDSKGLHVHDVVDGEKVSYGIFTDEDGVIELRNLGKSHAGEFDAELARKSFRNILGDPNEFAKLRNVNAGAWDVYEGARGLIGRTGRALRTVGRAAGAVGALFAIAAAVEGGQVMTAAVDDYARHSRDGDTAYADLDAIEIAVGVQDMTGNYFITTDVLDILLP